MNTNRAATPSPLAAGGITDVEWAVLLTLAEGVTTCNRADNRISAGMDARASARRFGAGRVEPVWRTVGRSPWSPHTVGEEWGVAIGWHDDRYEEVRQFDSRYDAERYLDLQRNQVRGTQMRIVSRNVIRGPWNSARELLSE